MTGPFHGKRVKQSLYFPAEMLAELQAEAARHERTVADVLRWAWRLAKAELQAQPAVFRRTERALP